VPGSDATVVATLAPCGAGPRWLLPVIDSAGVIALLRTTDGGGRWTRGAGLPIAGGQPAWSCRGTDVWMTARVGREDRVLSSADAGATWADRSAAPPGLSDLAMTAPGAGFAVSGGEHPQLWSVQDDGGRFTRVPLPGWVGTLGGQGGNH
jgi:photosystem II stability/assembly factor-like uncharacterized protein